MEFPIGMRFKPTDQELIYYLNRKIAGLSIPTHIIRCNGDQFLDPRSLDWSHVSYLNDNERYYFMKRKPLSEKNRKRVKRSCETGTWRLATGETEILDHENQLVGLTQQLEFRTFDDDSKSSKNSSKSCWIMHEYRIHSDNFQEWVLCRIKNDARQSSSIICKEVVAVDDDEASDLDKFAADLESSIDIDDQEALPTKIRRIYEEVAHNSIEEEQQELITSNEENLFGNGFDPNLLDGDGLLYDEPFQSLDDVLKDIDLSNLGDPGALFPPGEFNFDDYFK